MNRRLSKLVLAATAIVLTAGAFPAEACPRCAKPACVGPVCQYNPCIKYVDKTCRCRCCDATPTMPMVLQVKDPVTCCLVDVPVCVPACCVGAPCVDSKCGLLGNGKVFYRWDCGYEIKVVLTKRGNITVVYRG